MTLDAGTFSVAEGAQHIELGELSDVTAHALDSPARALPKRRKPSEILLFAVPRGNPSSAAISTCVLPRKYDRTQRRSLLFRKAFECIVEPSILNIILNAQLMSGVQLPANVPRQLREASGCLTSARSHLDV